MKRSHGCHWGLWWYVGFLGEVCPGECDVWGMSCMCLMLHWWSMQCYIGLVSVCNICSKRGEVGVCEDEGFFCRLHSPIVQNAAEGCCCGHTGKRSE